MMNEKYIEMVELNDEKLENVTGGKGYYGGFVKRIRKKSFVNLLYWLFFDDPRKKKKKNNPVVDTMQDGDDYDDWDDYDFDPDDQDAYQEYCERYGYGY